MKQTDLKMIKEVSKMLFTAVEVKSVFGFMVQHPFASNTIVQVLPDTEGLKDYILAIKKKLKRNEGLCLSVARDKQLENLLDMSKNNIVDLSIPEGVIVFKNHTFTLIDKSKNLTDLLMLLNKPWYMTFLKFTKAYMSPKDLGTLLGECWVMQEYPNNDANVTIRELIQWFKDVDKKSLMDEDEYNHYMKIKNGEHGANLIVYRGVSHKGKPNGLSWTTDYNKAKWFSERFKDENSKVYRMEIDLLNKNEADAVLACFLGRNEQEVVIDTTKCNNWEVVE